MKKQIVVSLTFALLCGVAFAQKPDDKKKEDKVSKEDKYKPRRIEIVGDPAKVRAALIKRELDRRWMLSEDHPDKLIFREPTATGARDLLIGDAHMREIFTLASDGSSTTIYAIIEFCYAYNGGLQCRPQEHRKQSDARNYPWNQLDKVLEDVKTATENK